MLKKGLSSVFPLKTEAVIVNEDGSEEKIEAVIVNDPFYKPAPLVINKNKECKLKIKNM